MHAPAGPGRILRGMTDRAGATRVLVVDDEDNCSYLVASALRLAGLEVRIAGTAVEALADAAAYPPDAVVLDVMLPDLDGFEVARRLQAATSATSRIPIIFLTARDATADKVEGLRLGVDDYVTKPFSIEELIERVKAVLRRTGGAGPAGAGLTFHDLELDEDTRDVGRAGRLIELTPTEYKLLHYLMANPRRVLTREQILEAVWDYTFAGNASVLETYISYLRHKVDAVEPPLIHTVRGVGYSLRLPAGF